MTGFGDYARPVSEKEIRDIEHELFVPLMFTGIHILEPEVFDYIPRGGYSDIVPTFYSPALTEGRKIAAHITDANWHELSTIPRYLDISLAMLNDANVFFGAGSSVDATAGIRDSILWDNVTVENDVTLYRTIVADDVIIPAGSHFENAAIVRAEMVRNCTEIPEKALEGIHTG